jgi:hypothetical protein
MLLEIKGWNASFRTFILTTGIIKNNKKSENVKRFARQIKSQPLVKLAFHI